MKEDTSRFTVTVSAEARARINERLRRLEAEFGRVSLSSYAGRILEEAHPPPEDDHDRS